MPARFLVEHAQSARIPLATVERLTRRWHTAAMRFASILIFALALTACSDVEPPARRDSGMGAVDAGGGGIDSGSVRTDAGTPASDAGSPGTDAGATPSDAGSSGPDAGRQACGSNFCPLDWICCGDSCGICLEPSRTCPGGCGGT